MSPWVMSSCHVTSGLWLRDFGEFTLAHPHFSECRTPKLDDLSTRVSFNEWSGLTLDFGTSGFGSFHLSTLCFSRMSNSEMTVSSTAHNLPRADLMTEICFHHRCALPLSLGLIYGSELFFLKSNGKHFSPDLWCRSTLGLRNFGLMAQLQTLWFQTHGYCSLFSLLSFLNRYTS
jgi:hypothetical protein